MTYSFRDSAAISTPYFLRMLLFGNRSLAARRRRL